MQFSEVISQATFCRFAPNSSYFAYYDIKRLLIKQSSVNLNNFAVVALANAPSDIAISPDSELIAVLYKEKAMILVFNPKGALVAKIEDPQNGMSGMLWAPDSVQLLVFSELLFRVSIYNLAEKNISYIRNPKLATARGCVFSSAGKLMALLQRHDCKDAIGIYHCGDWKMVNSIPLESFDAIELLWSPNDAHLVAWENPINYRLHAVCPFKGVVLRYQPYDFALGLKAVQFSKRGFFLAAGSFDEKVRLLNAVTWKLIAELDCSTTTIASPEAKIYKEDDSLKSYNRMKLIDRTQYKIPVVKPAPNDKAPPAQGVGVLQFSYDDSFLACRNDNMPYTLWIWNLSTLEVEAVISLSSHIRMAKWSREQNSLCIASGTDKILFWRNGVIMECSFPFENKKFNVQRFAWSNDNKRMLLFDKNQVIYADIVANQ